MNGPVSIDRERLATALEADFGGTGGETRTVARAAADLADDGRLESDLGLSLDGSLVRSELADAPEGSPADRWNWWIGSLEVAYGGYEQFSVRRYRR